MLLFTLLINKVNQIINKIISKYQLPFPSDLNTKDRCKILHPLHNPLIDSCKLDAIYKRVMVCFFIDFIFYSLIENAIFHRSPIQIKSNKIKVIRFSLITNSNIIIQIFIFFIDLFETRTA